MSNPGSTEDPTGRDTVEPFSDRSRAALEAATRALIAHLTGYLEAVRDIPAELSDEAKDDLVLPPDETVSHAVRAWNDAAGDHTELSPLHLIDNHPDTDDATRDHEDAEPGQRPIPRRLSIISRYDVDITDPDALFSAALTAREGHGYAPGDMTPDAVRRSGVGRAVYSTRHGDAPYSDVPGLRLRGGRTLYLAHDPSGPDPATRLDTDRTDPDLRRALPPTGRIDFLEIW